MQPPLQKFVDRLHSIINLLGKPGSRGELRLKSDKPEDQALLDLAYSADPNMMIGYRVAEVIKRDATVTRAITS